MNGEVRGLTRITQAEYETVKQWIIDEITPYMTVKQFNLRRSSYGLKHLIENDLNIKTNGEINYVGNGTVKYIMAELGYEHRYRPNEIYCINSFYKISRKFFTQKGKNWSPVRYDRFGGIKK